MRISFLIGVLAVLVVNARAIADPSPYAEFTTREVKALSAEQVEGYLAGRGMGMALAAELNGYPGPMHVLELSEELSLTTDQESKVTELFDSMHAKAMALGKELVAVEGELDKAFADESITQEQLDQLLDRIGAIQGRLRAAHLSAHLGTKALLTLHQNQQYAVLRGYASHEDCPMKSKSLE